MRERMADSGTVTVGIAVVVGVVGGGVSRLLEKFLLE
jgi:hypothetical protein